MARCGAHSVAERERRGVGEPDRRGAARPLAARRDDLRGALSVGGDGTVVHTRGSGGGSPPSATDTRAERSTHSTSPQLTSLHFSSRLTSHLISLHLSPRRAAPRRRSRQRRARRRPTRQRRAARARADRRSGVCPARARTHIVRRERRAPHARRTRGRVQREAHATRRGTRTRADTRGRARRACRGDTRGAVRRADGASGAPVCLRGARRAEASDCSRTEDADNTRSASSASTVRVCARGTTPDRYLIDPDLKRLSARNGGWTGRRGRGGSASARHDLLVEQDDRGPDDHVEAADDEPVQRLADRFGHCRRHVAHDGRGRRRKRRVAHRVEKEKCV